MYVITYIAIEMAVFGYFCLSGIFQMSEELTKQLNSYKAQLQQVEVALSTDPENEDLQKLQKDLQVCTNELSLYQIHNTCIETCCLVVKADEPIQYHC